MSVLLILLMTMVMIIIFQLHVSQFAELQKHSARSLHLLASVSVNKNPFLNTLCSICGHRSLCLASTGVAVAIEN